MFISKLLPIFVGVLESNRIMSLIKRPMRIARTLFISEWIAEEGRKVSLPRFLWFSIKWHIPERNKKHRGTEARSLTIYS